MGVHRSDGLAGGATELMQNVAVEAMLRPLGGNLLIAAVGGGSHHVAIVGGEYRMSARNDERNANTREEKS